MYEALRRIAHGSVEQEVHHDRCRGGILDAPEHMLLLKSPKSFICEDFHDFDTKSFICEAFHDFDTWAAQVEIGFK